MIIHFYTTVIKIQAIRKNQPGSGVGSSMDCGQEQGARPRLAALPFMIQHL